MRLILLGPPGAGKGTQANVHQGSLRHSADLHRRHVACGGEGGHAAGPGRQEGDGRRALVSDDIIIGLVKDRLKQAGCSAGYFFDGFPRTIPQAEALKQAGVASTSCSRSPCRTRTSSTE